MAKGSDRGAGGGTTVPIDDLRGPERARLLVLGEAGVDSFDLPDQGTLVLGRAEDCDVRIDRDSVSRRHARLHVGKMIEIEDAGSSNGTRVAGVKLAAGQRVVIAPGEPFELGAVLALVQCPPERGGAVAAVGSAGGRGAMQRVAGVAERVAKSGISVLLLGETGVGKEVMARRIHQGSPRAGARMVAINCGALTETLLESELFGHEAGAFTDAKQAKPGLFETANGGTVFLDEVGELPAAAQVKLLRVIEERKVMRVGGLEPRAIDVRFVSATNRDPRSEIAEGRFREDLYYRLAGITLTIPPLRERLAELPGLCAAFAAEAAERVGLSRAPALSSAALARLRAHLWPGNIRELRNVIERAVVLCGDGPVEPEHLFSDVVEGGDPGPAPGDERSRILHALQQCGGNQTRAAELLGISRKTLGHKLDKHGILRPQKGRGE